MTEKAVLLNRGQLLGRGAGAGASLGLSRPTEMLAQSGGRFSQPPPLAPIRISSDRLLRVSVCLRPFRTAGPRIETEDVGRKHVVHHYGHGGSGWSLSWGSALEAVPLAMATRARQIGVIGAGAIGLTTAPTAQRMGASVTIYAKERYPLVSSSNATGTWSPDSRLAMRNAVVADFGPKWERMARASFLTYQRFLSLPGDPVEWTERYELFDTQPPGEPRRDVGLVGFSDRIRDITTRQEVTPPGTHPFRAPFVERATSLTFNVTALVRQLESEFLAAGGRFVPKVFHTPADLATLPEKVVINCTGFGARALWRVRSVAPMRGQIVWLIPQPGATYGVHYRNLYLLARRDGIVLFRHGEDDLFGYGDDNEAPDPDAAQAAVAEAAALFPTG